MLWEELNSGAQTYSLSPEKFFLLGGVWIVLMESELHAGTLAERLGRYDD